MKDPLDVERDKKIEALFQGFNGDLTELAKGVL
jgi:hypothetical protein